MLTPHQILTVHPRITGGLSDEQAITIMECLNTALDSNPTGAVVELGCCVGCSTVYLGLTLQQHTEQQSIPAYRNISHSNLHPFHVYDSFEGLPPKTAEDGDSKDFFTGLFATNQGQLLQNLTLHGVHFPHIHKGWFGQIPDAEYPEPIAFAFLDGDYYTSITDSFTKIWHKLTPNATVLVHDYDNPDLPGAALAVHDWVNTHHANVQVRNGMAILQPK